MKKLEAHLKAKEELAEGLHLIDFEQLKIENQSLNEKIEERNEELLKLRKKTTTTVQARAHLACREAVDWSCCHLAGQESACGTTGSTGNTPHSASAPGDANTPSWVLRGPDRPCFGTPPSVARQLHSLSHAGFGGGGVVAQQVLTHQKEKLQFVQKQAESLHSLLASLDAELAGKRDGLNREKLERDALRTENARIKAASGIISNTSLLDDLEMHKVRA
jgi:hypothetical protein